NNHHLHKRHSPHSGSSMIVVSIDAPGRISYGTSWVVVETVYPVTARSYESHSSEKVRTPCAFVVVATTVLYRGVSAAVDPMLFAPVSVSGTLGTGDGPYV